MRRTVGSEITYLDITRSRKCRLTRTNEKVEKLVFCEGLFSVCVFVCVSVHVLRGETVIEGDMDNL